MKTLVERLEFLRTRAGSGRKLARRSGMTETHVNLAISRAKKKEAGAAKRGDIDLSTAVRLARGGRVSVSWLATGEGYQDEADLRDYGIAEGNDRAALRRILSVLAPALTPEIVADVWQRAQALPERSLVAWTEQIVGAWVARDRPAAEGPPTSASDTAGDGSALWREDTVGSPAVADASRAETAATKKAGSQLDMPPTLEPMGEGADKKATPRG